MSASCDSAAGFETAPWVEGKSDVRSDAEAGFVHDACEKPS